MGYKLESGGSSTTTHTHTHRTSLQAERVGELGHRRLWTHASETCTPGAGLVERVDQRAVSTAQATWKPLIPMAP